MAATYRTQDSCPTTCPLFDAGCYARGRIFALADKHGREDLTKLSALKLKEGSAIRFNVSGDFLLADGQADLAYIGVSNDVVDHNNVDAWSYTHGWRTLDPSMFTYVVNASCETVADVEEALAAGWQATVVDDGSLIGTKIAGRNVIQCPAQTRDVTCNDCRACGADTRTRPIIAFTTHGNGAKMATAAIIRQREASE